MKKINRYGFVIIILVYLGLLLAKVFTLPVLNDETPTPAFYINFSVWQIMMYPDHWPNNHILNTLLVKLFVFVLGNQQWVIRLPNLLSFLVFGFAIYRVNKIILKEFSVFFIPVTLLFVSNPYFLDFFGLCRGYGMSNAFALLSISYLLSGFRDRNTRHIWTAYLLSIVASYANFTLLVFWSGISAMVLVYFISQPEQGWKKMIRPVVTMTLVSLAYLALIVTPLIKMNSTNEFQYWTSKGFYWDTIYPFIEYSRSGDHLILNPTSHLIAAFIFMTVLANCIFILFQVIRKRKGIFSAPVFVVTALLLVTVCINILQCHIMHTPNLHGRTALFFYPMFIAVFGACLSLWPPEKLKAGQGFIAACFAFICIWHMADKFSFNWVRDWWHDSDTLTVMRDLQQENHGQPVSLKTTWFCYNSFHYYTYSGKAPWLDLKGYDKNIDTTTDARYYYLFKADQEILQKKYEPVKEYGDRVLMKRKPGV
jgi:hypothetical protein